MYFNLWDICVKFCLNHHINCQKKNSFRGVTVTLTFDKQILFSSSLSPSWEEFHVPEIKINDKRIRRERACLRLRRYNISTWTKKCTEKLFVTQWLYDEQQDTYREGQGVLLSINRNLWKRASHRVSVWALEQEVNSIIAQSRPANICLVNVIWNLQSSYFSESPRSTYIGYEFAWSFILLILHKMKLNGYTPAYPDSFCNYHMWAFVFHVTVIGAWTSIYLRSSEHHGVLPTVTGQLSIKW